MIRFRPLPGFTLFFVPLFALLIGLGVWQLQRLQWKLGLIAAMNRNLHAAPLTFEQAAAMAPDQVQYHRVALDGAFENSKESYVFTTDRKGAPVYHVLTPLLLDQGGTVMVDRGMVPASRLDPLRRIQPAGERHIVGVIRTPDAPGMFTPQPDPVRHIWYARDLNGMSAAWHLHLRWPFVVEADATPNPGGWPKGGQTVVTLRNEHLQYAITWFLLAFCLVIGYFAYHRARGRLAFGHA